jgi:hypothetical protein
MEILLYTTTLAPVRQIHQHRVIELSEREIFRENVTFLCHPASDFPLTYCPWREGNTSTNTR